MHALAAAGTGFGRPPRLVQVRHYMRSDAAAHYIPRVCALDFIANPDTARTQNAPIVIDYEAIMRGVNSFFRIAVGKMDMSDAQLLCHRLQFAMSV